MSTLLAITILAVGVYFAHFVFPRKIAAAKPIKTNQDYHFDYLIKKILEVKDESDYNAMLGKIKRFEILFGEGQDSRDLKFILDTQMGEPQELCLN